MNTRIQRAIAARHDALKQGDKGFTLIELLVVVIIIGILAAIAIPVYIGVQNNAKDSSVKSDVSNLKTALVSVQTSGTTVASGSANSTTPLSAAFKSAGATYGADTTGLSWTVNSDGSFCVEGDSDTSTTAKFHATDSQGVSAGGC